MLIEEVINEFKRTHLQHIEDIILTDGHAGGQSVIDYLQGILQTLQGAADQPINVSVKWDGAPAIFAGKDPSDGKFFVAKKGVFNKNPKVYKTNAEIDDDTSGDLAAKLKACLAELPALGIDGVIQGDLLFTKSDIKNVTIDGEDYVTFHPNTLVYAVPAQSELAKSIKSAEIGIVWHTFYEGSSFETMKAVFGKDILSTLKKTSRVWSTDVDYKDVSGKATLTKEETDKITDILSDAGKIFYKIDAKVLNHIRETDELREKIKTFNNTKVRNQLKITNVKSHVAELIQFMTAYFDKEIETRKSAKSKAEWESKKMDGLKFFNAKNKAQLENIFTLINLLAEAKLILVNKLDEVKSLQTFLLTKNGYEVTGVEGYVAIDHLTGNAVKLVDRMRFSYANFSPDIIKGWQR